MKRCPDCAEEVQDDARVCKHCGYDFLKGRNDKLIRTGIGNGQILGCLEVIVVPILIVMLVVFWRSGLAG